MKWLLIFLIFIGSDLPGQPTWRFHNIQVIKELSDTIAEESFPLVSHDNKTLYFVRTGHPQNKGGQDIWMGEIKNTKTWSVPQPLPSPINSAENEYIAGAFDQGLFMAKSMKLAGKNFKKLYLIKLNSKKVSKPQAIDFPDFPVNSRFSGYFILDNANLAIVSLDLQQQHNEDLYMVRRDELGHWQKPVSLGDSINTPGFEISPFLLSDQRTLFFASNGQKDSDGTDIYWATRIGNSWQKWTTPKKVEGVNTPAFDAYFFYNEKRKSAYWVSNYQRNNSDIFYGQFYEEVEETNQNTAKTDHSSYPNSTTFYDEIPEFLQNDEEPKYHKSGDAHIYFNIASSEIEADMKKMLMMIAKQLKQSKQIEIKLQGYADDLGSEEYNLQLSAKRAEAVKNYLVELGINAEVFLLEPMGEVGATATPTEQQRELNRRVDIVVNH